MVKERRKHTRLSPGKYLKVYNFSTSELIGELANLSSEGAMFITPEPIRESTSFRCRVPLSQPIMGHEELIFDAVCRWCRRNVGADRWESGYELTVTGIDIQLLSCLVLGFKLNSGHDEAMPEVRTVEMENRREATRFEFQEPMPVYEMHSYRQIGELADLSTLGIRMIGPKSFKKGSRVECRVRLPKHIFGQEYLCFQTTCMWCRKRDFKDEYESGHQFCGLSEQDAAIILHLLIHSATTRLSEPRRKIIR